MYISKFMQRARGVLLLWIGLFLKILSLYNSKADRFMLFNWGIVVTRGQKDFIIVILTIIVLVRSLWRAESVFDDKTECLCV